MEELKALIQAGYSVAISDGQTIVKSRARGVQPLLDFLSDGGDYREFSAADKIVGKAAALLFVLLGVKEVYGAVMSRKALPIFEKFHIIYSYGALCEAIINRNGDGPCPMEKTVADIDDPQEGLLAIKETRRRLLAEKKE